jgi:hypothetical protein
MKGFCLEFRNTHSRTLTTNSLSLPRYLVHTHTHTLSYTHFSFTSHTHTLARSLYLSTAFYFFTRKPEREIHTHTHTRTHSLRSLSLPLSLTDNANTKRGFLALSTSQNPPPGETLRSSATPLEEQEGIRSKIVFKIISPWKEKRKNVKKNGKTDNNYLVKLTFISLLEIGIHKKVINVMVKYFCWFVNYCTHTHTRAHTHIHTHTYTHTPFS